MLCLVGFFTVLIAAAVDSATADWNRLLHKHVVVQGNGRTAIRYSAVVQDSVELRRVGLTFSGIPDREYESWSRSKQKAFLINAYNLAVWNFIARFWPIKSIEETLLGDKIWKTRSVDLLGKKRSLDWIENKLQEFGDSRIHFGLHCGSRSCPPLRREAFSDSLLDHQLDQQTVKFIASDCPEAKVKQDSCSALFSWYKKDFESDKHLPILLTDSGIASPVHALVRTRSSTYLRYLDSIGDQ